jgi:hypothetical protein
VISTFYNSHYKMVPVRFIYTRVFEVLREIPPFGYYLSPNSLNKTFMSYLLS